MSRARGLAAAGLLLRGSLAASEASLVVPFAVSASSSGGARTQTELRVLNKSDTSAAAVRAVYHCGGPESCSSVAAEFVVGPGQNVAIVDAVARLFGAPETEGAIELFSDVGAGTLVVTARLCTERAVGTECRDTIAVSPANEAPMATAFGPFALSADSPSGFHTEAGGFNPGPARVMASATLRRVDGTELASMSYQARPGEFIRFDGAVGDALRAGVVTDASLSLTLAADGPFVPWAALVDNRSGDRTPLGAAGEATPLDVMPVVVALSRYRFSPGGPDGPPIRLQTGVTYQITFRSVDVEHGISAIPQLGIAARSIAPGDDDVVTVTPGPSEVGLYAFACTRVCGGGHGDMHGSIEVETVAPGRMPPTPVRIPPDHPRVPRTIPERIPN